MASSFLTDFMKKREKAITNTIVAPTPKQAVKVDSIKALPHTEHITLGYIVEHKPKPKIIVEYLEQRRDAIIKENDSD